MTDIYGNHLRRWSLDVATGAIGCFADAVDLRATPADDVAAIEAHNALMHETVAALDAYEAALRVDEPEEPHTQPLLDDDGEEIGTEPTPAFDAWTEAQFVIGDTSDAVKALALWRRSEPAADDDGRAAWEAARTAAIEAFGNAPALSVDPVQAIEDRARRDAINEERERRIVAGGAFSVPGIGSVPVTGRDEDIRNLQGLGMAALLRVSTGDTTTITAFRDAADAMHDLTPPQVLALWQASASYVSAIYQASWAIKADMNLDHAADANWP